MTSYLLSIVDPTHPGRPPLTMNQWRNAHWATKTAAKRRIHYQVVQQLRTHKVPTMLRVRVTITQHAPDGRRRDADGLSAFRKDALDAIVKARILPDDNHYHVVDGGNHILIDRHNPRIDILIEQVTN